MKIEITYEENGVKIKDKFFTNEKFYAIIEENENSIEKAIEKITKKKCLSIESKDNGIVADIK